MILIFSEPFEPTTADVIAWLNYYRLNWARINDFDFVKKVNSLLSNKENSFTILGGGKKLDFHDIKCIWFRRTPVKQPDSFVFFDSNISRDINQNKNVELQSTYFSLISFLRKKKWFGNPSLSYTNKIHHLRIAAELGINIPDTIVTSSKKELLKFKKKHHKIVIKPLYNVFTLTYDKQAYVSYTTIVTDELIKDLPETFFTCLCQKYISKKYEIRTFFMDGGFYSMVIFSQSDNQTSIDFRKYNTKNPNRTVPYLLPKETEEKMLNFMRVSGLNTGTLDIIYSIDNQYVFLEINPVGQFGMVSYPCNYYIEKKISLYLKKTSERENKKSEVLKN